jgi:hypothetical protein
MDNGRETITLPGSRPLPAPIGGLTSKLTSGDWLAGEIQNQSIVALSDVSKSTIDGSKLPFWNQGHILSDKVKVLGMILQEREDIHPFQRGDAPLDKSIPERGDFIVRWIFGKMPANDINRLTENWDRRVIVAVSPLLRLTWFDAGGAPVLEVKWPIVWRSAGEPDDPAVPPPPNSMAGR